MACEQPSSPITRPISRVLEKAQSRLLQSIHTTLPRQLTPALQPLVGTNTVTLEALNEQLADGGPVPDGAGLRIGFAALHPRAGVLECSASLVGLAMDHLLGCHGEFTRTGEGVGEIGKQMLCGALEPILTTYADCWRATTPFHPRQETDIPPMHPGEPWYRATYLVTTPLGAGHLVVSLRLEAWQEALAGSPTPEPPADTNTALLEAIGDCLIETRVLLGSVPLPVQDIIKLRPGDIISLERPPDAPVDICIGNQPKFQGQVHVQQGHYAITIAGSATGGVS